MGEKQSSTAAGEEEKEELTLKCICLVFFFRIISPGSMGMYWTIVSYLQSLTGPGLMLLYPLYASIRAIESPSKVDDEQWLTYWILYSFLTLVKMAFIAWLVLPQFRGASFIYQRFVGEQLIKYRQWLDRDNLGAGGSENQRKLMEDIQSPKAKAKVEHYISENGPDAFDIICEAAMHEAQKDK